MAVSSQTIRRVICGLAVVALLFFSNIKTSYAMDCGSLESQLKGLFQSSFTWVGTAVTENMAIQIYIRFEDGYIVFLGIDNDLNACKLIQAYEFQSTVGSDI